MYAEFDLEIPSSLGGALEMLGEAGDRDVAPLAGGTNLLVDMRGRRTSPAILVSIGNLPELRRIEASDGEVAIGGTTTLTDVRNHRDMQRWAPSLLESIQVFAGQMVRNAATVAGNVAYASPAADLVPPLLALDARVRLQSASRSREVPLEAFYTDYKRTERRADELITRIGWPKPAAGSADVFYKLARRKGDAIAVVDVAVGLTVRGGKCERARIALGAVAPIVKRARDAERMLEGEALSAALIEAAARQAAAESSPVDDIRASAEYRRHAVHMLARRLLTQASEQLR